jgi:hypothetical protein
MMDPEKDGENGIARYLLSCSIMNLNPMAQENFQLSHPRYRSLQLMNGAILDIGAGAGGLGQLMHWPTEQKNKWLIGCDLESPSDLPMGYRDWIGGGWQKLVGGSGYGGAFLVHVIEHLPDWKSMLLESVNLISKGGVIYIEWPSFTTISWPSAHEVWGAYLKLSKKTTPQLISTFNFYDDSTHVGKPPMLPEVIEVLQGFQLIEEFKVDMGPLADELVTFGLLTESMSDVTLGIWAKYGFANYLVARKI